MDFEIDPKVSFSNKLLKVVFRDLGTVYDLKGNLMHEKEASFLVKHFIYYPPGAQSFISFLAKLRTAPALTQSSTQLT